MKALTIVAALSMAVVLAGCGNLRSRTVNPCPALTNPCGPCAAPVCAPAKVCKTTVEK